MLVLAIIILFLDRIFHLITNILQSYLEKERHFSQNATEHRLTATVVV